MAAVLNKADNLTDLSPFEYQEQFSINRQVTSTKAGTAYKGTLKQGQEETAFTELYYAPFADNFMPGCYVNLQYKHGDAWLTPDKVSLDAGLLWNIHNESGRGNILSIMPYVGWLNLSNEI